MRIKSKRLFFFFSIPSIHLLFVSLLKWKAAHAFHVISWCWRNSQNKMPNVSMDVLSESLGIEILHSLFILHRNAQEFHVYFDGREWRRNSQRELLSILIYCLENVLLGQKQESLQKNERRKRDCRTKRLFLKKENNREERRAESSPNLIALCLPLVSLRFLLSNFTPHFSPPFSSSSSSIEMRESSSLFILQCLAWTHGKHCSHNQEKKEEIK